MTKGKAIETRATYVFDDVCIDPAAARVTKGGQPLALEPKAYDVLLHLVDNRGELVEKTKLLELVWPGTFVGENNLAHAVSQLRRALGDSAKVARYIETVPTRGYRFIAPVVRQPHGPDFPGRSADEGLSAQSAPAREKAYHASGPDPPSSETSEGVWIRHVPVGRSWRTAFVIGVATLGLAALTIDGGQLLSGRPAWRLSTNTPAVGENVAAGIRRLAVLPLRNLSTDPSQDYFVDGMTAAIIGELARVEPLHVISHTSVMQYRTPNRSLPRIARELGVDAVVEGAVLREGDHVRISVNLVHAETDRQIWTESYTRPLRDVLTLQAEIAQAVVFQVLRRTVVSADGGRKARVIPEAYELYLRGQFNRERRSAAAVERAIDDFERALATDPAFAPAVAGLAGAKFEWDIVAGELGASRAEVRAMAFKAIALDPSLAEAHVELGRVLSDYDWDWIGAESAYRRAIDLKPNLALAYREYSFLLQAQARFEEAVAQAHKAVTIDPRSPVSLSDEGRALYRARRFDEAEDLYTRSLGLDPGFEFTISRLLDLYIYQRRFTEASRLLHRLEQSPSYRTVIFHRIRLEAATGQVTAARRLMTEGIESDIVTRRNAAAVFVALGDHDQALAMLEAAVGKRRILPITLADPELDPLRSNPRFIRLVERMGLPVERLVVLRRRVTRSQFGASCLHELIGTWVAPSPCVKRSGSES
jgi:TolB-like protein/DNA-binding winged helix-turn-helix (wHTH) protein/Tfp pilus assembly protein PilF